MGLFDTTAGGAATGYPGLLAQGARARQVPRRQITDLQGNLDLSAGLLGMVPVLGDAVGLAADVNRYRENPELRTMGNYGLSALGLLPFVPGIVKPQALKPGLKGDAGYAYHATNSENLHDIASSGSLKTHKPDYGTDQFAWPDGSRDKRAYFSQNAEHIYQFAPENGTPVILRTKLDANIKRERGTGDLFSTKPIPSRNLEYLGDDGKWHSLIDLK